MRICNLICLMVFLFATASAVQRTDAGVECVRVEVRPPGSGDDDGGARLTNKCGKDITAFRLVFRDPAGSDVGSANRELLPLLAGSQPLPDIFRRNTTRRFPEMLFDNDSMPSVTAIIFADRSTLGDPLQVASLISSRARGLKEFQERLKALDSVSDWNDAVKLRIRAAEAQAQRNYALRGYMEVLARQQEHSNVSSWATFITQERKLLMRVTELFEFHLGQ